MTELYNCPGPCPAVQWPIIRLLPMQHGGLMVSWELGGFVRALLMIHLFISFHFIYFFNSIFNKWKSKSLLDLSDHSNDLLVLKEWKDAFNQIIAFARIIPCATCSVIIYTKPSELIGIREIKIHVYAKRQRWTCTSWPSFLLIFRLLFIVSTQK